MTCRFTCILSILLYCFFGSTSIARTCTGAANCHACSCCTYCKHCAEDGGTCGVKAALERDAAKSAPNRIPDSPQPLPTQPPLQIQSVKARISEEPADYQTALLSLSDPAKLATLDKRGANPRLKKVVYWLDYARKSGRDPSQVLDEILQLNGYQKEHAQLIKTNLLRNIKIGDQLGFFAPENLELLRRGGAPRVMAGPYAGDVAQVDHIIPVSLAPEIGNDLSNLELMPSTLNLRKNAKVGERQKGLARDLRAAGVIAQSVLLRVQEAKISIGESL